METWRKRKTIYLLHTQSASVTKIAMNSCRKLSRVVLLSFLSAIFPYSREVFVCFHPCLDCTGGNVYTFQIPTRQRKKLLYLRLYVDLHIRFYIFTWLRIQWQVFIT